MWLFSTRVVKDGGSVRKSPVPFNGDGQVSVGIVEFQLALESGASVSLVLVRNHRRIAAVGLQYTDDTFKTHTDTEYLPDSGVA